MLDFFLLNKPVKELMAPFLAGGGVPAAGGPCEARRLVIRFEKATALKLPARVASGTVGSGPEAVPLKAVPPPEGSEFPSIWEMEFDFFFLNVITSAIFDELERRRLVTVNEIFSRSPAFFFSFPPFISTTSASITLRFMRSSFFLITRRAKIPFSISIASAGVGRSSSFD